MLVSDLIKNDDDGLIACAIFKATGDSQWLNVESDYSDEDIIKLRYQVYVRYPYIINDPVAFVSKCFGDHFYTYDNQADDTITIYCNGWFWAVDHRCAFSDYMADVPEDDYPNIFDHATIIEETVDYAD